MIEDEKLIEIKKKVEFLFKKRIAAHISIKDSPQFYNGLITEFSEMWFKIDDFKFPDQPVWFMDVNKAEPYIGRKE